MASYNQTQYSQIRYTPDHVYYDLTARSYASNETDVSIPIKLTDTRSNPIINDISEYHMSIVRFQVDTFSETLPVFFFQTERYTTDRDLGIYEVAMEYDNGAGDVGFATDKLIWAPQIQTVAVPQPPSVNENGLQANSEYYYAYNFQYVIKLLNDSLVRCFEKLQTSLVPTLDTQDPPFFTWEKDQTARLYAREDMYDSDAFPRIRIYFNRSLYSILSSLPSIKVSNIGSLQVFNYYQLIVCPYNGAKVSTVVTFGIHSLIYVDQEYSTVDQFSPVASVLFISSTIPIIPNSLANPQFYIDGQPNQLSDTYNKFANVITDVSSGDLAYKPSLLYIPSGEYRMIDMMNNKQPLNQIDIEVHWTDKTGVHRPILLAPNSSVTLKMMFRKKKYIS